MSHEVENRFKFQWTEKYNFWWVVSPYTCQIVLIPMHQLTCWGDLFSLRSCVCLKELSSDAKSGLERKHKRGLFVRSQFQKREKGHYVATPTWLVKLRDWLLSQVQLPSIPVTQPKQHNHHLWYLATWHPYKENCSNHANGIFQVKCLNSVSQKGGRLICTSVQINYRQTQKDC